MKRRPSKQPNEDDQHSPGECPGAAKHDSGTMREDAEGVADDAKEIAFLLVCFEFFPSGFVHDAT
jgi:hypothetical protein